MWILANDNGATTLRGLDLHAGSMTTPMPVDNSAVAIAEVGSGTLGIGLATATTGSLELFTSPTAQSPVTVPLGAPVRAVAATGSSFYVLNGNASSASVSIVDPQQLILATLPAPVDAISIAVSADGSNVYALEPSGRVSQIDPSSGRVTAAFPTGNSARAMVLSPDGTTLYVLKGATVRDIAVVNLGTESEQETLPAPANSVGVAIGADGTIVYSLVGTRTIGNIQAFPVGPAHQ